MLTRKCADSSYLRVSPKFTCEISEDYLGLICFTLFFEQPRPISKLTADTIHDKKQTGGSRLRRRERRQGVQSLGRTGRALRAASLSPWPAAPYGLPAHSHFKPEAGGALRAACTQPVTQALSAGVALSPGASG